MTYTTELTFTTLSAAKAYLFSMGFSALPVRNRFVSNHVGDSGEARVSFAHIATRGAYVNGSEVFRTNEYIVHETDSEA